MGKTRHKKRIKILTLPLISLKTFSKLFNFFQLYSSLIYENDLRANNLPCWAVLGFEWDEQHKGPDP